KRMRPVHKELAEPVARGLLGAATVDGGPTDEQRHIIDAIVHGYFDVAIELPSLEPLDPAGLAAALDDPKARHRVVELMIVLEFPGEAGGGDVIFVAHDFSHVLSGYEPNGPGELALQAMLVSATDGDQHFSNFCASLSLHEAGLLESTVAITPKVGTLARPG